MLSSVADESLRVERSPGLRDRYGNASRKFPKSALHQNLDTFIEVLFIESLEDHVFHLFDLLNSE